MVGISSWYNGINENNIKYNTLIYFNNIKSLKKNKLISRVE